MMPNLADSARRRLVDHYEDLRRGKLLKDRGAEQVCVPGRALSRLPPGLHDAQEVCRLHGSSEAGKLLLDARGQDGQALRRTHAAHRLDDVDDLSVDPEEAARRVAGLSDEEIEQIAGRLDDLPAGEGALGAVIGAILVIFLVLLITDLQGLTDVFPFVKR